MRSLIRRLWRGESGQDIVEWALLLALASIGSAALMNQSNGSISGIWTAANAALQGAPGTGVTPSAASSGGTSAGTGGSSGGGTSAGGGSGSSGSGSGSGHHGGSGHSHGGDGGGHRGGDDGGGGRSHGGRGGDH